MAENLLFAAFEVVLVQDRAVQHNDLNQQISLLLESFGRFGVDLGLDRITALLDTMGNPHWRVPTVHVAGTNGKGSVCAYLSAVLKRAGYRVGRYTSPHLVSWCERITINEQPIPPAMLLQRLRQVIGDINPELPSPTQFEVLTAAAWLHFAAAQVDIAVVEVGLGGRLDATNVVDDPLVSVITSLSRDHWQRLGSTLTDIAGEKAGILKAGRPAVIGPLPPEAEKVVRGRLESLGCSGTWPQPAVAQGPGTALYGSAIAASEGLRYSLPFPGEHQLVNSAVAIAALKSLRQQGWSIPDQAIIQGMAEAKWPGRLQWVTWQDPQGLSMALLVDGAHNPAAALMLRRYVDDRLALEPPDLRAKPGQEGIAHGQSSRQGQGGEGAKEQGGNLCGYDLRHGDNSVVWVMGMLSTKDHRDVLSALLRPGDRLHLVPVPGHSSADPENLAAMALDICPDLAACSTHNNLRPALEAVVSIPASLKVLCGSLYLIGHCFATEHLTQGGIPGQI